MRLATFFLLTHGTAAATVAALTALCQPAAPLQLVVVAAGTVVLAGLAAWRATTSIGSNLHLLEMIVADHEQAITARTGLREFDRTVQMLGSCAQRWETAAATTRRQKRELQAMIGLLGGSTSQEPSSGQLRELLAELANSMQTQHQNMAQATADSEWCGRKLAESATKQQRALAEATACSDQLITTGDRCEKKISSITANSQRRGERAVVILDQLRRLIEGLDASPSDLPPEQPETKRSSGIQSPSQEWRDGVEELHARAQLLVLNTSLHAIHHPERVTQTPDTLAETAALAADLLAATEQAANLLNAMQQPAELPGSRQPTELNAVIAVSLREVTDELTDLCLAQDEQSLSLQQLQEIALQQQQFARQLQATLRHSSSEMQRQHATATRLCDVLGTLAAQLPSCERQLARLRNCGPSAACVTIAPLTEMSLPAPAGFIVSLAETRVSSNEGVAQ